VLARSLTGTPKSEGIGDGRRRLVEDLKVDLGARIPELQSWAGRNYRTEHIYTSSLGTTVFRVPRDFTTLGPGPASIPGIAFPIMGDRDLYEVAGWLHDAGARWEIPHKLNDWLFWWVARSGDKQVTPTRAWLGWAALRTLGWMYY
jgi:hypothetical protein